MGEPLMPQGLLRIYLIVHQKNNRLKPQMAKAMVYI